jgi:hypothetical protein
MRKNSIRKFWLMALLLLCNTHWVSAQENEFGIMGGAAQYLGDLNPRFSFKTARYNASMLYRYNFNPRMAFKLTLNYGMIAASDHKINTKDSYKYLRNLDFSSQIFAVEGTYEINFLPYILGSKKNRFTPYMYAGLGMFYYNPTTNFNGQRIKLEQVGTEGQKNQNIDGNKGYSNYSVAIPFGGGFKFALNNNWSFLVDISSRRTFIDYMDDVSKVYPDFNDDGFGYYDPITGVNIAELISDRSYELTTQPIGRVNQQRGTSKDNDRFNFYSIGITYTIRTSKCPTF